MRGLDAKLSLAGGQPRQFQRRRCDENPRQFNQEGTTIVMVTHSPYCAGFGNRIIRLPDGQVMTENIVQQYL